MNSNLFTAGLPEPDLLIRTGSEKRISTRIPESIEKLKKQVDEIKEKKILEHGMEVGKKLAFVLSGGNTTIDKELSEDDMYALELEAFIQLIQMEKTQARIKHTLSTGKPLVN